MQISNFLGLRRRVLILLGRCGRAEAQRGRGSSPSNGSVTARVEVSISLPTAEILATFLLKWFLIKSMYTAFSISTIRLRSLMIFDYNLDITKISAIIVTKLRSWKTGSNCRNARDNNNADMKWRNRFISKHHLPLQNAINSPKTTAKSTNFEIEISISKKFWFPILNNKYSLGTKCLHIQTSTYINLITNASVHISCSYTIVT